ncbi:MAG: cytochrome c biogenesis CcdA family protein [Hyphomicrobiaceae bacterium]
MSSFLLAYIAGLVTILSPCVLPLLPIVLGGALNAHRHGPLALAAGLVVSFTAFGLLIAILSFTSFDLFGYELKIRPDSFSKFAAALMILFGIILLSSTLQQRFAIAAQAATASLNNRTAGFSPHSLAGQLVLGLLLGAVWTPCVGPTLGAAITLAAKGTGVAHAATVMFVFALGTATSLIALMFGTRGAMQNRKELMAKISNWIKPLLGVLLVGVGLLIITGLMTEWEALLLEYTPKWLNDFVYSF